MYIRNNEVAGFFGARSAQSSRVINSPFSELRESSGDTSMILLGKERTLYDYDLHSIHLFCESYRINILTVLCEGLAAARGNGNRRWINTQHERSNFSVNIFTTIDKNQYQSVQDLQERIAMAIIDTLSGISTSNISIAYPFHYLQDGGKIGGHLVQKKSINEDREFLRIGIGINTDREIPVLPENDELAQNLYQKPTTLSLEPGQWIGLATKLRENITQSIVSNRHDDYLGSLNIQHGDTVEVYHDNGTISFGESVIRGQFDTIDRDGGIHLIGQTDPLRVSDYHIRLIRR